MQRKNSNSKACFKKGQIGTDILVLMLILFVFGMVMLITSLIGTGLSDELIDDELMQSSPEALETLEIMGDDFPTLWDNMYLMILILVWVGMLVTSFLIETHPLFFYISLVIVIIILIVGMWMGNAFLEIAQDPDFSGTVSGFPKMMWIAENWLIVIMIISFTTMLALYAKGYYT